MATQTLSMSKLYRMYKPRILSLLNNIKRELEENGYRMDEPCETSDQEYEWCLFGGSSDRDVEKSSSSEPDDSCFSIEVTIIESKIRDGEDDFGVNFKLDLIGYGGEIIGGFTPYNYSDRVWVSRKDPDDVQDRWELFENGADPCEVVATIQRHYAEKQSA